jgi:hypothetical protein
LLKLNKEKRGYMENPIHSVFTVKVEFKGKFYDAEIKPTLNGDPIIWMQDRVNVWESAERTDRLFSQKIVQMLNNTNISEEHSLEGLGVITSVENFSFEADESKAATQIVWDEFIDCLQHTAAYTTRLDPVDENTQILGTRGVGITLTSDAYLNLGAADQKAVRLSLFLKKCYEHFASVNGVVLLPEISEYLPSEEACLTDLLYPNASQRRHASGKEAKLIWQMQSEQEKKVMASHVKNIRVEMELEAARLNPDVNDSVIEALRRDLSVIDSDTSEVEELLSSGEEMVASGSRETTCRRPDVLYLSDDETF